MDKQKLTILSLKKLSASLSKSGHTKLSSEVNKQIKLAEDILKPIGDIYKENDKFYRKYQDSKKMLVIKEVDESGHIIRDTTEKEEPTESWSSWLSRGGPVASFNDYLINPITKGLEQQAIKPGTPSEIESKTENKADDVQEFKTPVTDDDRKTNV